MDFHHRCRSARKLWDFREPWDSTNEMDPHGHRPMMLAQLHKGITLNPELGFEHGNGGWKYLDEQKVMEILRRGFKMINESGILMPHP
jgi:hypothetical protein